MLLAAYTFVLKIVIFGPFGSMERVSPSSTSVSVIFFSSAFFPSNQTDPLVKFLGEHCLTLFHFYLFEYCTNDQSMRLLLMDVIKLLFCFMYQVCNWFLYKVDMTRFHACNLNFLFYGLASFNGCFEIFYFIKVAMLVINCHQILFLKKLSSKF
jgi:hypothetical protein